MGNSHSESYKAKKLQNTYAWSGNSNSGASKYSANGNLITSSDRAETKETRGGWFFSVFAAALIPMIILFISQIVMARRHHRVENYGNGENAYGENGYRWKLWRNESSRIVLWVVYIWIFILFALIAWYGWKMALTTRASQNMRTLIGGLLVFWNLVAIVGLLVATLSVHHQGTNASWSAQFPAFVTIACFCWFLFGIVWFAMIWRRLNRRQRRAGAFDYKSEEDIIPEDDDLNIKAVTNNRTNNYTNPNYSPNSNGNYQ